MIREADTPQERWAATALRQLAADDPDRAGEVNGVGFNGRDGEFGHSLAQQLRDRNGRLSDKQWAAAIRLCKKYWRQVGKCPEDKPIENVDF